MDFEELDCIDYDKINRCIKEILDDDEIKDKLQLIDGVRELAIMTLNVCEKFEIFEDFSDRMKFNDSINLTYEFFNSISKEYGYRFLNILNNDYIITNNSKKMIARFNVMSEDSHEEDRYGYVYSDGSIIFNLNGTVGDVYNIMHEFTHKLIVPTFRDKDGDLNGSVYLLEYFFGEISTILNELLLDDYIINRYGNIIDSTVNINNRFVYTFVNSASLLLEFDLLDLYKKSGKIDKEILIKFFESLDKNDIIYNAYEECLDGVVDVMSSGCRDDFLEEQLYIIGISVASYFHNEIKNNPDKIKDIIIFNSILGHSDYELNKDMRRLSNMNIPIFKNGKICLDDKVVDMFRQSLEMEVNDCLVKKRSKKK